MRATFKDNETECLELFLSQDIFNPERSFEQILMSPELIVDHNRWTRQGIELIIRPECNQKCEYCYIARYGKELYPMEHRLNNEQIIERLDAFLDYVFNTRGIYMDHWELFAGDLFYDNLYFDVLDVFYKHLEKLYPKYRPVFDNVSGVILTPTNFSFITDDEKCARVNEYIKKFEKFNWDVGFSISTDGKYAVDTRENRPLDDAYFEKLFNWAMEHPRNGFHPIISASNIDNAIKNYEWWRDMFDKYYGKNDERGFLPYWLEARNDEWDNDSIYKFNELLMFMLRDRLAMCDNDIDHLAYHFFKGDGENGTLLKGNMNDMLDITVPQNRIQHENLSCSISALFIVNLSNLSMVPCHRLTYPQFKGGHFIYEDGKITGVEAFNFFGYINIITVSAYDIPKCNECMYHNICHHGCLGAQFEASGEVFLPALSVCELMKQSRYCILQALNDMGVLESARQQGLLNPETDLIYDTILREESFRRKGVPAWNCNVKN